LPEKEQSPTFEKIRIIPRIAAANGAFCDQRWFQRISEMFRKN